MIIKFYFTQAYSKRTRQDSDNEFIQRRSFSQKLTCPWLKVKAVFEIVSLGIIVNIRMLSYDNEVGYKHEFSIVQKKLTGNG